MSRMHNASGNTGPGSYHLPDIIGSKTGNTLSQMKSSPQISFGTKPEKKSYYHECYTDFKG